MEKTERVILVIDTDTAELRKLREILTREGYSIMTATDHNTALQLSRKIPFDFVLAASSILGFGNNGSME